MTKVGDRGHGAKRRTDAIRSKALLRLEENLELPMVILGLVWLVLLVIELIWGLSSFLEMIGTLIWITFILDFVLRFSLAPNKSGYLAGNWLTLIALIVPALRVFRLVSAFRLLRAARAARGLKLVRVITSVNRGMGSLAAAMGRHGFGYVVLVTAMVAIVGAAGMYAFERSQGTLLDYGTALWWTAMIMTTMGSEYWPKTAEGRVLCLLLALYAFTVFGYVTATLASFLIGRDAASGPPNTEILDELRDLRSKVDSLKKH